MKKLNFGSGRDGLYKALGEGERTSKKVATIKMTNGKSFKRRNVNQYGEAEGGNDYEEHRSDRSDRYAKGGKMKEEIAYEKEQHDAMFNSQYGKGATIKSFQREPKYKIGDTVSTREIKFRSGDKAGQIQYPVISGKITDKEPFQNGWVYSIISNGNKLHKVTEVQIEKKYAKGGKMKQPTIVRGFNDDEPYEYGKGGKTKGFAYTIGGL
jgi:hypothetical protein